MTTNETVVRGKYAWKLNKSGKWAWFDNEKQATGAFPSQSDADYCFEAHCLADDGFVIQDVPQSTGRHPDHDRLSRVYGSLSDQQIQDRLAQMSREIESYQRVGRREFNGNGGRRYSAAMSSQAARDIGQEMVLLRVYLSQRGAELETS